MLIAEFGRAGAAGADSAGAGAGGAATGGCAAHPARMAAPISAGHRVAVFLMSDSMGMPLLARSARCHANGAVDADDLAVQHAVAADRRHELGIFLRAPKAGREGHLLAERVLCFLREPRHHRRAEDARRDAHHADAEARE